MTTAYCIDVSGSVGDNMITAAFDYVAKGIEPGDCIIVFDIYAQQVSLDWRFEHSKTIGRGGSDATECLALAKKLGMYRTVLISDGYLMTGQLKMFDKFIDIEELVK